MSEALRKRHHGAVGASWYVDETYIRGQRCWCYLYRAIDRDSHLIDARLSDTRDLAATEAFFRSAWTVTGVTPDRITTDGHDAYPRAIRNVFGDRGTHRTNRYLNNHLEQDHRGMKQRYRPQLGSKPSPPPHVSVASLMRSARFSATNLAVTNLSCWLSAGASIEGDLST